MHHLYWVFTWLMFSHNGNVIPLQMGFETYAECAAKQTEWEVDREKMLMGGKPILPGHIGACVAVANNDYLQFSQLGFINGTD